MRLPACRTVADGTCSFPKNMFGCETSANRFTGGTKFIAEDYAAECEVRLELGVLLGVAFGALPAHVGSCLACLELVVAFSSGLRCWVWGEAGAGAVLQKIKTSGCFKMVINCLIGVRLRALPAHVGVRSSWCGVRGGNT